MKIILLILFLSLIGALIGVDGLIFCLTALLFLPALYFMFGIFFPSPFIAYACFLTLIISIVVFYRYLIIKKRDLFFSDNTLSLLVSSFIFTLLYSFAYYLCKKWPDFYSLGERMRDLALIGAGLRDPILIQEPWMSGLGLNYYAYWYRFAHVLSVLLNLQNWEVYHVLVAFAFSFLGCAFYVASREIIKFDVKTSLFCAVMLLLMSNPAGLYYFFLSDVSWWYPSRVISGTIHEFPAWSFLLGDAHPHFLNSGCCLWFITLSFIAFNNATSPLFVVLTSLILPFLFFENANMWEVPIWLAIYGSVLFVFCLHSFLHKQLGFRVAGLITQINIKFLVNCLFLSFIAVSLFEMKGNFIPEKYPVKLVLGEVLGSDPSQFFMHWGFLVIPILILCVLSIKSRKIFPVFAILISLFLKNILPFLLILSFINFLRLFDILKRDKDCELKVLFSESLVFSALALLIVPELIYLDDPYGADIERMNTFFKISYVNWSLMFFSCTYLLKNYRLSRFSLPTLVLLSSFFFAVIPSRALRVLPEASASEVDKGLLTVDNRYPGVKELVDFLSTQPMGVVLEAQGPPYSETTLVATLTGFPAYLGWINHIDLLMPMHRDEIQRRNANLELVYNSLNCPERLDLLKREGINYLVVGDLEYKSYPNLENVDFSCIKPIFDKNNYKLFSIP